MVTLNRSRWRWRGLAAALAACLLGSTACWESVQPITGSPDVQPAIPVEIDVQVTSDDVIPEQLVLDAGEAVRVTVRNSGSQPCEFYLADYLSDLEVPARGEAQMGFTVPNLPGSPDAPHSTATFGCVGEAARTGTVVVIPRPNQ